MSNGAVNASGARRDLLRQRLNTAPDREDLRDIFAHRTAFEAEHQFGAFPSQGPKWATNFDGSMLVDLLLCAGISGRRFRFQFKNRSTSS